MTPDQKNDDHWYILLNFTKFFSAGSRLEMKVLFFFFLLYLSPLSFSFIFLLFLSSVFFFYLF